MTFPAVRWLMAMQLLLGEQALCGPSDDGCVAEETVRFGPPYGLRPRTAAPPGLASAPARSEWRTRCAGRLVSTLEAKLQRRMGDGLRAQRNVSCEELLSASTVDDTLSSPFPKELLGLSLVPALVVAGCPRETQTLVLRLYDLLGVSDTEELLMEVESLIRRGVKASPATSAAEKESAGRRMDAVMFNIQQLATAGETAREKTALCKGWTKVNGTVLLGAAAEGSAGSLQRAVSTCEGLGVLCAGVTSGGRQKPGQYQAVLRRDSRILPSEPGDSWIHRCETEDVPASAPSGRRLRRGLLKRCIHRGEERVYSVMEWIPAVSTLYNLGTAVYYASVNCSETAKQRALLTAVDLGTDALMVATGGTAGVAGYAFGAGVKTGVKAGVKYLLNSMKQEDDVLVNQISWEEGVFTVQ